MTSAPPLRLVIGRSRIVRIAMIGIALAAMAAPIAMDVPDWLGAIVALSVGWYAGRTWRRFEDEHEGRVIARDSDGAWSVDGQAAELEHHEIVGPIVSLRFRVGEKRRTISIAGDAVSRDDFRRMLVHLRGVHRPDAAIR